MQDVSHRPGERIDSLLADIITPLTHEREQLLAAEKSLASQLAEAREARKRIDKVLHTLVPESKPAKPKLRPRTGGYQLYSGSKGIAQERMDMIEEIIRSLGEATARDVRREIYSRGGSISEPTLYTALKSLRLAERIRLKGTEHHGNAKASIFAPMNLTQEVVTNAS